jgi:hypothetical protein
MQSVVPGPSAFLVNLVILVILVILVNLVHHLLCINLWCITSDASPLVHQLQ